MTTRGHGHQQASYDDVAFTVDALAARADDTELTKLSHRVDGLLHDWENIDAEGRRLKRAVTRATAHVHVADATLDAALGAFARDLVALVSGNAESDLYKRFFPEAHEDVIAMGLDSEVPEVTLIVYTLEQNAETPGALKGHLEPLRSSLRLGNGALAARADALAELGRHQARVEAWNETARSTLKSLRKTLGRIAEARKLPSTWAEAFFVDG